MIELDELLTRFTQLKCGVIGDLMLDRYFSGTITRSSPEADVPVLDLDQERSMAGGAGNVALNLLPFCKSVGVCSLIGADRAGDQLAQLLSEQMIDISGVISVESRQTTVKTRLMNGAEHLLRVDDETTEAIDKTIAGKVLDTFDPWLDRGKYDVVVIQDYNKGLLHPTVIKEVLEGCRERSIAVVVDPKYANAGCYQGVDLLKPNLAEFAALAESKLQPVQDQLKTASIHLRDQMGYQRLLVTLSDQGVFYHHDDECGIIAAHDRKVADVCGAGDTVVAMAALALAAGMSMVDIAGWANLAGGIVCEYPGVKALTPALLQSGGR